MVEFCIGKVQSITKDVNVAQAKYTDAVTKIMSADTPVAELEHDVNTLDASHLPAPERVQRVEKGRSR